MRSTDRIRRYAHFVQPPRAARTTPECLPQPAFREVAARTSGTASNGIVGHARDHRLITAERESRGRRRGWSEWSLVQIVAGFTTIRHLRATNPTSQLAHGLHYVATQALHYSISSLRDQVPRNQRVPAPVVRPSASSAYVPLVRPVIKMVPASPLVIVSPADRDRSGFRRSLRSWSRPGGDASRAPSWRGRCGSSAATGPRQAPRRS